MKIKIIDAYGMGVHYRTNGEVVEVEYIDDLKAFRDIKSPYIFFLEEEEGKYFEVIEEDTSGWSGEGIPPVGTVCECITEKDVYLPCKVIAHGMDHTEYVIVQFYPNEYGIKVDWTRTGCRPIKSEKDKAVEELMNDLYESVEANGVDSTWRVHAEHLYNIGYRKTQQ